MIHVPIDATRLMEQISEKALTWLQRAQSQAELDEAAGRHVSTVSLWSELKPIFMAYQHDKCAYCERQQGSSRREWDVEHFRPKKRVDEWHDPSGSVRDTGAGDGHGYFRLAFAPSNYLVSCKSCNQDHKKNYFPVAARRQLTTRDPESLRAERPYLLNPVDVSETPPERLIGFHGLSPKALSDDPVDRRRALITIDVLGLSREDLNQGRARVIVDMFLALARQESDNDELRAISEIAARVFTRADSAFTSCARHFADLYRKDRARAAVVARVAAQFLDGLSSFGID